MALRGCSTTAAPYRHWREWDPGRSRPIAIGAVVLAAIAGGATWLLLEAHEDLGRVRRELEGAHAVIAQREVDARENAKAVAQLAQKIADTEPR